MSAEPFVMTGPDRLVQWVNPAFVEMCGYSLEELKGKSLGPILQGEKTDPVIAARMRQAVHEYPALSRTAGQLSQRRHAVYGSTSRSRRSWTMRARPSMSSRASANCRWRPEPSRRLKTRPDQTAQLHHPAPDSCLHCPERQVEPLRDLRLGEGTEKRQLDRFSLFVGKFLASPRARSHGARPRSRPKRNRGRRISRPPPTPA